MNIDEDDFDAIYIEIIWIFMLPLMKMILMWFISKLDEYCLKIAFRSSNACDVQYILREPKIERHPKYRLLIHQSSLFWHNDNGDDNDDDDDDDDDDHDDDDDDNGVQWVHWQGGDVASAKSLCNQTSSHLQYKWSYRSHLQYELQNRMQCNAIYNVTCSFAEARKYTFAEDFSACIHFLETFTFLVLLWFGE